MKSAFFLILFCIGSLISAQVVEDSLTIPVEIKSSRTLDNGVVSISRTEFLTFAGAFDDPTRLLKKYPGISTANDQANSVIYHGLPSQYHQWQFYGARILNPNHQSNAGTVTDNPSRSSGGVNMMSGQVIGEMNFYGNPSGRSLNSLAGNSDVKLRDPYRDNLQFNLSLIGLEAGVDQIFGKDNNQSLMLNYRYSTVGLLTDLGLDFGGETIKYSDLTAKYSIDTEKAGHFDIYAIYGRSTNDKDTISDPQLFKDYQQINYEKTNLTAGIHHHKELSKNSKFSQTLNFSTVSEGRRAQEFFTEINREQDFSIDENLISYNSLFEINKKNKEIGIVLSANYIESNYTNKQENILNTILIESDPQRFEGVLSAFIQKKLNNGWIYQIKPAIIYNTESQFFFFAGHANVGYGFGNKSITFNTSLSQQEIIPEWTKIVSSKHLGAFTVNLNFQWGNFLLRPFYSSIKGYESDQLFYSFSTMNSPSQLYRNPKEYSVSRSITKISGLDAFYSFSIKGFDVNTSFSLLNANSDEIVFGSKPQFNVGHIGNVNISKKWRLSNTKYLGWSLAFHHRGGTHENLIDSEQSNVEGFPVYINFYQRQLSNYYRLDTRIYYIIKKGKYKSTVSLDIQNVTNRENDAYYFYEPTTQSSRLQKQLGLLPVLSWRISI